MSILNEMVNIFKPKDTVYKKKVIAYYKIEPKEDLTAYELFHINKIPDIYHQNYKRSTIEGFEESITIWYNALPETCKRHLKKIETVATDYRIKL